MSTWASKTTGPSEHGPCLRNALGCVQEAEADRVTAWRHGLVSDGILEWGKRCLQVAQYSVDHGDAHIGFRDNEDSDLVRWARKQRYAFKQQTLPADRCCACLAIKVTRLVLTTFQYLPCQGVLCCAMLCCAVLYCAI